MLNDYGEEIGGVVKTFETVYQFVDEFGVDNIVVVSSEYKDELKIRGENRYYYKNDEDKLINYINQKMLLEELLSLCGVCIINTEEFFSRQIVYTIALQRQELVKFIVTEDRELVSVVPNIQIYDYKKNAMEREGGKLFWELCIKGFPFFLDGIRMRDRELFLELENKNIKSVDGLVVFLSEETNVSSYLKKKLLNYLLYIEKNYSYLVEGFFSWNENLCSKRSQDIELFSELAGKHGLEKRLSVWPKTKSPI